MGHRLMTHKGKCHLLHGHNYAVTVTLAGKVNDDGMILDFGILKDKVKEFLDLMDHKTMLHRDDPLVAVLTAGGFSGHIYFVSFHPTVENIAMYIFESLEGGLGDVLESVTVMETDSSSATVTKN